MASITPSSGGTITSDTIEAYFCGAIWLLQGLESDTTRNPSAINNITSSISDDSRSLTASCNFRGNITLSSTGELVCTCNDYLTSPSGQPAHFTAGSGGTLKSTTIQAAILEAARIIDALEADSSKNTQGLKTVAWSITSGEIGGDGAAAVNVTVTNFPLIFGFNSNGTQTLLGKPYLL